MTSFNLTALTMSGIKFEGPVTKLVIRAADGDICILGKHTDYTAPLGCGTAKITTEENKEIRANVEGGFISVQKDQTRIIATKFDIIE